MKADIAYGVSIGNVTVWIGGGLSWSNNIDTWKGLVAVDDLLWATSL
jgi:hypothetical protein